VRALPFLMVLVTVPVAAALRDPTEPPRDVVSTLSAPTLPRLTSVLIAADRKLAIIDGNPMVEGTERDGIRLVAVRRDGVTVVLGGERIDLPLNVTPRTKTPVEAR
jgi:hypothetical protein